MQATILDLRYKMKNVLKALDKREKVKILYHGKVKGTIIPSQNKLNTKIREHPFFGMKENRTNSVNTILKELRKERYDAVWHRHIYMDSKK